MVTELNGNKFSVLSLLMSTWSSLYASKTALMMTMNITGKEKYPTASTYSEPVSVYRWARRGPVYLVLPAVPGDTCTLPCTE